VRDFPVWRGPWDILLTCTVGRAGAGGIEMRLVQFTGTPVFSKDGTESMPKVPETPRYFWAPSLEVDQAWDKLMFGEFVMPYLTTG
jgi:hypothetical protein